MARSDRHTKKKTRLKPRFFVILFFILALLVAALFLFGPLAKKPNPVDPIPSVEPGVEPIDQPPEDEIVTLSLLCAGDAMVHKSQWVAAQKSDGTYDFRDPFRFIKPYVEAADLAVVNTETTFAGDAPEGYPAFCTPDEFATALRWTGFDVVNTANNHMYDKGLRGLLRTLSVARENNMSTVGSRFEWEEPYTIVDVKGLRVGFVTATYETKTDDGNHALNGIRVSDEAFALINTFRTTDYAFPESAYETDLLRLSNRIEKARESGADIVICFFHWGQEYNLIPNDAQKRMAQDIADAGADAIFGSHPHVPQPMTVLTSAKTGNAVPVYFSLGNLISNQRRETLPTTPNNINTEEALLARVTITYNKTKGAVESVTGDALPCWLDKYTAGGAVHYALIPLDASFETNEALLESGHLPLAKDALERMTEIVGKEYIAK